MPTVNRFEDLEAWKKARRLNRVIYEVTSSGQFSRDFGLRDQIRRASISVMSNIAEGFERDGNREFRQFLYYAKASVGEVKSQLYAGLDAGHVTESEFKAIYKRASETARVIAGLIRYLKRSDVQGIRFR